MRGDHPRLLSLSHTGDPLVGTLVDERYLLLGRLGEGAMGVVYRAWQRSMRREVALKVLPVDPDLVIGDPKGYNEMRARFRREVQLAARIESAFVARVHDFGELEDGGLYFTMEKVTGTPLDALLRAEGPLPAGRVIILGQRLGQALAAVHALGLVHRDIKPGNLMLVGDNTGAESLKLLDFGIARAFEVDVQMGRAALTRLTVAGTLLGSYAYMAPEQLARRTPGRSAVGPRTDVYAAGITLFELATGRLPFEGPTPPAFAMQHQSAPVPSILNYGTASRSDPAGVALDRVITRALAKEPADRYPDGGALATELAEIELELALGSGGDRVVGFDGRDTVRDDEPLGAVVGAVDPGALRGISTEDVRVRVASATLAVKRRRRLTKGRVALALAIALGVSTVLWDLFDTLPR